MKFDVVTFGSALIDNFVYTNVSTKGHELHYPLGAKILIEDLKKDIGGGGTNTAVAFSRLNLKTGCISAVGDDVAGKEILNLLKKEKIKFLGSIKKGKQTGTSIILDSKDKDRTILTYRGVTSDIEQSDVKNFEAKWLYYSSLLEKSFETQIKIAKEHVSKGTKLVINPSQYHIERGVLNEILKITHVLILNKEEAEMLMKKNNLMGDTLFVLKQLGPKIIVITDKDNPVRCLYDGKEYTIQPNRRVRVVERTGAGDAFASGFTAGLIYGLHVDKCLKLAVKESEAVIQHFGAKNNLLRGKLK